MSITQTLDVTSLGKLQSEFRGQLILRGDNDYDHSRVVWNAIADRYPALIARCTRVDDVIAAVRFARRHDLVIAVRGGGHSVAGFSTCDGGVVIDLSGMRGVTVDPAKRTARVEGGALLEQLDRAAQEYGLACPVGVVGHTGVAGLTLGGGHGPPPAKARVHDRQSPLGRPRDRGRRGPRGDERPAAAHDGWQLRQ